jgi:hypothetical protein
MKEIWQTCHVDALDVAVQCPHDADPHLQKKSRPSAASIRQLIAVCRSARFCSRFGSFVTQEVAVFNRT